MQIQMAGLYFAGTADTALSKNYKGGSNIDFDKRLFSRKGL